MRTRPGINTDIIFNNQPFLSVLGLTNFKAKER